MGNNTLNIRHYIFGVSEDGEEFITTTLNETAATRFAQDHKIMFSGRYTHYEIRMNAETLVAIV